MISLISIPVLLISYVSSDTSDVQPLWPSIENRVTTTREEEDKFRSLWQKAKDQGDLLTRRELWKSLSETRPGFQYSSVKYNNSGIIRIITEMYRYEYNCWKKYNGFIADKLIPAEIAACEEEVEFKPKSEYDEGRQDNRDWINAVALSTLSSDIMDIVLSPFCGLPVAEREYLSEVSPEHYLAGLFGGVLDKKENTSLIRYNFHGEQYVEVIEAIRQIEKIFQTHPDIRIKFSETMKSFSVKIHSAYEGKENLSRILNQKLEMLNVN
jgi:hypothetical protein